MTLYMIGLGLGSAKDITLRGLEAIKKSDYVYLENYTSTLPASRETLEKFYGKEILLATRDLVEKNADEIIEAAKKKNVCFLVVGDVFGATTHTDLYLCAKKKKVEVELIHNASIINAVSATGLELYKFGKTTSIVFEEEGWFPNTPYEVLESNQKHNLHTLFLLDIKISEPSKEDLLKENNKPQLSRYMSIRQAIEILFKLEKKHKKKLIKKDTMMVGVARLTQPEQKIVYAKAKTLLETSLGGPLHCLIIPGKLHFVEEEFLEQFQK
ncbi:diphthine synthase [Candidatus Woesearchaeota archaeon]|nr:diphthine synthase [Candidatus Woesearchaeota archaeon]